MHHPIKRPARSLSNELHVAYADFDHARRAFPNCERTALRAYAASEAARLANRLIQPKRWDESFSNVVALFADTDVIGAMALRSRRFDAVIRLLRSGRFQRRLARRLVREGKLSAEVLL